MERITYRDIPAGMFEKLRETEDFINNSSLHFRLLEIVRLRIAQINACAYCVDMHYKELKHTGESELRLSSLCVWKETPYFSEKERAVLHFSEALNQPAGQVSEEIFENLQLHFSKEEICFLTLATAQIGTWTRLMKTCQFVPGNYQLKELAD